MCNAGKGNFKRKLPVVVLAMSVAEKAMHERGEKGRFRESVSSLNHVV